MDFFKLTQYINPKRTDFKNYFIELFDIRPNEDLKNKEILSENQLIKNQSESLSTSQNQK